MFLVCALLFTTVFSYSMIANASSSFTPRLDASVHTAMIIITAIKIFITNTAMVCQTAQLMLTAGAYEILGRGPGLCHYDAYEWYDYNDGIQQRSDSRRSALLLVGNITETAKQAVMLPLLKR